MPLNKKNIYFIYLIIILGFLYSCFVSFKYLEKYDVYSNTIVYNGLPYKLCIHKGFTPIPCPTPGPAGGLPPGPITPFELKAK